jgi:hypothetical protein
MGTLSSGPNPPTRGYFSRVIKASYSIGFLLAGLLVSLLVLDQVSAGTRAAIAEDMGTLQHYESGLGLYRKLAQEKPKPLGHSSGGKQPQQRQDNKGPAPPYMQQPSQPPMPPPQQPTAVVYVYHGRDWEHRQRLEVFVSAAMQSGDGVAYHVVNAGQQKKFRGYKGLPQLPSNGTYLSAQPCNSTWGVLAEVAPTLELGNAAYVVVVDSYVIGPLLPTYMRQVGIHRLHAVLAFPPCMLQPSMMPSLPLLISLST